MIDADNEINAQDNPAPDSMAESEPISNETLYSKEDVSKVVRREREKAYEKGKREALMQQEQNQQVQSEQAPQQAPMQQQASQSLGGMQQLSQADIERMIAEKAPQALHEHVAQLKNEQMINSFVNKMQAAEARYPGLEEQLNKLDYNSLAPIVQMANDMENTGDIMKELLDNPMKMGNLLSLSYAQPHLAAKAMADLSHSIKVNQDAIAQDKQAQDPMSQLKSSPNSGMDNANLSVKDLRAMFGR